MPGLTRSLTVHPATPAPMVHAIEAGVFFADGKIVFRYCLRGDMARLRIPEAGMAARRDLLWEHSCFEAFAALEGDPAYREFNFSPSGQWAIYAFGDYRRRQPDPVLAAPRITSRATEGRLELEAAVLLTALPGAQEALELPGLSGMAWEISLSAVVETVDIDSHSYWALRHPLPQPDFHLRESFALRFSLSE